MCEILISKARTLARVNEVSHGFTYHQHINPYEVSHPPFTPQSQSITALYSWYTFPVPVREYGTVSVSLSLLHQLRLLLVLSAIWKPICSIFPF